jgi:hypothetical protein
MEASPHIVITGLDTVIHTPGTSRRSVGQVDGRIKSGHDEFRPGRRITGEPAAARG